ncbi:MAG: hypothetical protein ABSC92_09620 [Rhizomicrobium sp.]|jgi:hypothetical protein
MRSALLVSSFFVLALAVSPATADGGAMPEHKITQSESYIMLAPMYATILDGTRPSGMLMVAIGLDIPDVGLRNEATRAMPILRDAYVRNLMSFAWTHIRPSEQPDVVDIANRLQLVTDRTLRRPGAHVLLAQVASRISP